MALLETDLIDTFTRQKKGSSALSWVEKGPRGAKQEGGEGGIWQHLVAREVVVLMAVAVVVANSPVVVSGQDGLDGWEGQNYKSHANHAKYEPIFRPFAAPVQAIFNILQLPTSTKGRLGTKALWCLCFCVELYLTRI